MRPSSPLSVLFTSPYRYLRQILVFAFVSGVAATARDATELTLNGTVVKSSFVNGEQTASDTGELMFTRAGGRDALRMFDVGLGVERKAFFSTDFDSVYQSERFENQGMRAKTAYGEIAAGRFPNLIDGWGSPELYYFGLLLALEPETVREGGAVKKGFLPEFVVRRGRETSKEIRTEFVSNGPRLAEVKFWAVDPSVANVELKNTKTSFLVGLLTYRSFDRDVPVEFDYTNFTHIDDREGVLIPRPLTKFTFLTKRGSNADESLVKALAYDRDVTVSISDARLSQGKKRYSLVLSPPSEPPFRGTASYETAVRDSKLRKDVESTRTSKYQIVFFALIAIFLLGLTTYLASVKRKKTAS